MVSFPLCKINLGLNVTGKRADGFHDLVTCFYPVPWTDVLEIVPSAVFSFAMSGVHVPETPAGNLCVRAYEMLKTDFILPGASIHLLKILPVGAGLGGGSADGAFTLNILNELFELSLSVDALRQYAARLGSDCAFFIESQPAIGTGRGERLENVSLSLKGKYLVILKPSIHVSTAEAFAAIHPRPPKIAIREIVEHHPLREWRELLHNDFEESIFKRFPVIQSLQKALYASGAAYASMSGSGSSVFGLFDEPVDPDDILSPELKPFFCWSGFLD